MGTKNQTPHRGTDRCCRDTHQTETIYEDGAGRMALAEDAADEPLEARDSLLVPG